MAAVNRIFLRISATLKAPKMVETIGQALPGLLLDELAGPARGLDPLAGGLRELVRVHGELLGELAAAEDLDRHVALGGQAGALERGQVHRRAVVEAALEVVQVHVLRVRPERLQRHRHLLFWTAQLAAPHVGRVLVAPEAGPLLRARARAIALVAAARGLAVPGAVAAADALAVAPRALGGLEVVQADLVGLHYFSSTVTR